MTRSFHEYKRASCASNQSNQEVNLKIKTTLIALVAFIGGIVVTGVSVILLAPGIMMVEDPSSFGYEETVQGIVDAAEKQQWKVVTVHELNRSLEKAGHDVLPAAVIELCRPDYAARILADDGARVVSSLMPCRIAVYQTADGRVTVSRMNTSLMSKLFGGLITEVMAAASADSEAIIGSVIAGR